MLRAIYPTQLSTLLDAQLVRCFLVDKVLREKHTETLGRMHYGVSNLGKRTREGGATLIQTKARRDHLKVFIEESTEESTI